ncbi:MULTISPECIES: MoaD/ThiS family protein [unclassified Schlesneria]|uniref:MoaD/ThiS family protein n=1 Tax=unclassified Schlesneria TaxID=2762017 RepID=UPI002EFB38A4
MLRVKLFAQAKQLVGSPQVELPWADGQSVTELKQQLGEQYPQLQSLLPRLLVAVNSEYAGNEQTITTRDEVACFPPVSGG